MRLSDIVQVQVALSEKVVVAARWRIFSLAESLYIEQ